MTLALNLGPVPALTHPSSATAPPTTCALAFLNGLVSVAVACSRPALNREQCQPLADQVREDAPASGAGADESVITPT